MLIPAQAKSQQEERRMANEGSFFLLGTFGLAVDVTLVSANHLNVIIGQLSTHNALVPGAAGPPQRSGRARAVWRFEGDLNSKSLDFQTTFRSFGSNQLVTLEK